MISLRSRITSYGCLWASDGVDRMFYRVAGMEFNDCPIDLANGMDNAMRNGADFNRPFDRFCLVVQLTDFGHELA